MRSHSRILIRTLGVALALMMFLSCLVILPDQACASPSTNVAVTALATPASVPTTPLNLTADAGNEFIWLWWDHPANQGSDLIKNYTVYRNATSSSTDFVFRDSVSVGVTNTYNDSMLTNGVTYLYKIVARSDAGVSGYSNVASATPSASATAPGAVQNLVAENQVYSVQLNWTNPSSSGSTPIRSIYLFKETVPGSWQSMAKMPPTTTGYLDNYVVRPGSAYNYLVRCVSSTWGAAQATVSVIVGGTGTIPGSPENLTPYVGFNQITLSWDRPTNPSANGIDNYTIYRSNSHSGPFTYIGNLTDQTSPSFYDYNVVFGHMYYYQVKSNNEGGSSVPSNIANATLTTDPMTLSAFRGNGQVLLTWYPLFNATAYDIYRSTEEGVQGTVWNSSYSLSRHYWYDNSTTNGNTYYYTMRANLNNVSYLFSDQAKATPVLGTPPAAPTNLIATPDYSGVFLNANLAAQPDILLGYSIYRGESPGTESATPLVNQTRIPFYSYLALSQDLNYLDESGLQNVNYTYYVTVWNMFGQSPPSNEATSFYIWDGDRPDPVVDLSATGGSGQVTLTWNKPTYQGTANLLYYTIFRFDGSAWNYVGYLKAGLGQQTYVDDQLSPGTTYQYRIEVGNRFEYAAPSNVAQATTTVSYVVPSAPLSLVASSGTGYVQLSWSAPTTVGPGITSYKIFRGTTAGGEGTTVYQSVSGSTLTYNDSTVTAGHTYYYVVAAVNSVGTGINSNEATGTPPAAAAPSAPLSPTAFASIGQVQVNWSAPSTVGTGITEYRIYRGTTAGGEGTTPIATVLSTILTFTDTNVMSGTPYFYTVKAVNAAGAGPASGEVSATAVTVPGVPSAPLALTAVVGSNYILLNWTAPITVGSGITDYKLYRGTTAGGEGATPIAIVADTVLTYNDTTIDLGTPYYYVVKAVNAAGTGDPSNEVSATVVNTLLPSAPKNVSTTPGTGQIVVAWVAPDSSGASPITGYQIYRSVNGSQLVLVGNTSAAVTSFTDTDVDVLHTYGYAVAATNSNGNSPTTAQVTSTPTLNKGTASDDNTMLFLGIGLAAIVGVVGLAALMLFKRKK